MPHRDPLQRALASLMRDGRKLAAREERVLVAQREKSIPRLIEIVEQHARHERLGRGWGVEQAARLLLAMGAEAAVPALLRALGDYDPIDVMYSTLTIGLQNFGSEVIEPALAAIATAPESHRGAYVEVLCGCGVQDPRIRAALLALLETDTELAASLSVTYGDDTVVDELLPVFDSLPLRLASIGPDFLAMKEVTEAVRELGGEIGERRRGRFEVARQLWKQENGVVMGEIAAEVRRMERGRDQG